MATVQVKLYNQLVDMDYAEFLSLWYHKLYGAYGGAYGIYAGHVDGYPDVLGGSWAHLWYEDGEEGLFAAVDDEELASLVLEMKFAVTTLKEMHEAMVAALATLRGLPAPQNDREYYSLYDNLERAYCVATDHRRRPSWLADQNYRQMTLNMLDLVLQMKEIVARFGSKILNLSDDIRREEVFNVSWESTTFRALPPLWEIASREELLELEDSFEVEPEQRIDDIVDLAQEGMLEPKKAIVFLE
ncbi:MAG: hypothetical protein KDE28_29695, partial [Anaerolineales bacterium]|nr:hypothetical protein [Anaerolineales bacterium]